MKVVSSRRGYLTIRSVHRRLTRSWDHKMMKRNIENMVTTGKSRCKDRRDVMLYPFLPYTIFNRRLHKPHNAKKIPKV